MLYQGLVAAIAASSLASASPHPIRRTSTPRAEGDVSTVLFPLNYKYGANNKVSTAIYMPWSNTTIDAVYDQGSENFWVMAPDAIVNWGCNSLGCQGQCNATETQVYDYTLSPADPQPISFPNTYMYGLFDKILKGSSAINDTLHFTNDAGLASSVPNVQVALENYLQNRLGDSTNCSVTPIHDVAILGVSPYQHNEFRNTSGPHVRKNLVDDGQIGANVHSMWFDEAPADIEGTFTGGGLMGGIDTSKFTGPLVKVPYKTPERQAKQASVGYYVSIPTVKIGNVTFDSSLLDEQLDGACFLDSGTQIDEIPIHYSQDEQFLSALGLGSDPVGYTAWPGSCDSVPADKKVELTWQGVDANETVTISVPLRNYVRNNMSPYEGWCTVNVQTSGCLLAAPFSTAAFFAADDEREEVALAQGGVAARGSAVDAAAVVERIP